MRPDRGCPPEAQPAGPDSPAPRPPVPRHGLWGVWFTWGLALVLWVNAGNGGLHRHLMITGIAVALWLAGCGLLIMTLRRGRRDMQLLKKKKPAAEAEGPTQAVVTPPETPQPAHMPAPGALRDVVVTAIRKDVFIAHGSHLSGQLEAEGNIVAEGSVEGNITSTHQVRVDTGGVVKGDIRAAHIIINGRVTGRCYADAVTLLEQGRMEGDVFTDELAIERGGVFVGQSCLPQPDQVPKGQGRDSVKGAGRRDVRATEAHQKERAKAGDTPSGPEMTGRPGSAPEGQA
ncbi:polymer-forming cytoskeletal protein [Enterobacter hormaechei]